MGMGTSRGGSYQLSVISYQLSVISYQLSVISYQLSVISYQLSLTGLRTPRSQAVCDRRWAPKTTWSGPQRRSQTG
ncbi:MAG: hypothetical protein FJ011_00955 [Chloroflexi bacterium]|nr:hypothetical protein [Chloroflexota bacterium]